VAKKEEKITAAEGIKVLVHTPAEKPLLCRGFYQIEEDVLYAPLVPGDKFFSFLDSAEITLDIDHNGHVLFIQILTPRHSWTIVKDLAAPVGSATADIRFVNFREPVSSAQFATSPDRSILRVKLVESTEATAYQVADHLICEITPDHQLAALWITAIEDDRGAQGMAAWREQARRDLQERHDRSPYTRTEIKRD
jgi:hypothetical protein